MAKELTLTAENTVTDDQMIEALKGFAQTAVKTVGLSHAYQVITFATVAMDSNPDLFQKIVKPENLSKIVAVIEGAKSGTMNQFEVFAQVMKLKKILD